MFFGMMFFGMPGGGELVVIGILIVVLLFGAAKVPQLARSFGQAMGEFKKAKRESELNLKNLEDSVTGDEKGEIPKTTAKAETKTENVNIKEVAAYMGIETEGKTEEELKAEVQAKMKSSTK
jgi:sec-independent protein translocase protein TatA